MAHYKACRLIFVRALRNAVCSVDWMRMDRFVGEWAPWGWNGISIQTLRWCFSRIESFYIAYKCVFVGYCVVNVSALTLRRRRTCCLRQQQKQHSHILYTIRSHRLRSAIAETLPCIEASTNTRKIIAARETADSIHKSLTFHDWTDFNLDILQFATHTHSTRGHDASGEIDMQCGRAKNWLVILLCSLARGFVLRDVWAR